jgi:hypothetical protein
MDDGKPALIFITQVVDRRVPVFEAEAHLQLLQRVIHEAQERYFFLLYALAASVDRRQKPHGANDVCTNHLHGWHGLGHFAHATTPPAVVRVYPASGGLNLCTWRADSWLGYTNFECTCQEVAPYF